MADLRAKLPPRLRRRLGAVRRDLVSLLGGTVPAAPSPSPSPCPSPSTSLSSRPTADRHIDYDQLVELLFPGLADPVARAAVDAASSGDLGRPETIRRMIGAIDQQVAASTTTVRLGPEDVVLRDVGGVTLALDAADASVARQIDAGGGYEPHLTAIFERYCRPGMTVVDVGANIGYYSLLASRLAGASGHVVAIEPSSENCRLLITSLSINGAVNVEVVPVACDRERGWAYLQSHVGSNGGLVPGDDVIARRGTVVPTFPLDELVPGRVDLVKLDVEGAEGRVVAGARRLLARDRPIVTTELSCEMLPRVSGVTPADYLAEFLDLGYGLFVLDKEGGEPVGYGSAAALLDGWSDPFRIEDLLLLPG